ncbi:hypothetical protein NKH77_23610 [Streptomyces sp. M19]
MTFVLTGLDIEAKAALVRDQMEDAFAKRRPAEVRWTLARTDHADAPVQEEASALLRLVVRDADADAVGRAVSGAAVELALAGYPGFHVTAPPGRARPTGVRGGVRPRRHGPAHRRPARRHPAARPRPGRHPPLGPVPEPPPPGPPPSGPTRRAPLGLVAGARSGDKGGAANIGVWARTDAAWRWLAHPHRRPATRAPPGDGRTARHPPRPARPARPQLHRRRAARRGRRRTGPLRPAGQGPRRMAALPHPRHPQELL